MFSVHWNIYHPYSLAIEPVLQRLTEENLCYATVNVEDEAHLDVSAREFWGGRYQRSFYDVIHLLPATVILLLLLCANDLSGRNREDMNKEFETTRVEIGSFTPLVFSTFGGMGGAATTVYKRLASLLSLGKERPILWFGDVLAALLNKLFLVAVCHSLPSWN